MSDARTDNHRNSAFSGFLAASICMAICQIIGLVFHLAGVAETLLVGVSLSTIAFGGTYAGSFFATLAASRRAHPGRSTATQ